MAAVELLIEHAVWLRREDFVDCERSGNSPGAVIK
jgi:hypothetical protein